jgi:HEPN domain-containing protein
MDLFMTNNQGKFDRWLELAQYDLETAEAMYSTSRWLYVTYMCQQALEKLVKGLYTNFVDDDIPYIHNISKILKLFEDKLPVKISDAQYKFFNYLSAFYINARYELDKQKLSIILDKNKACNVLATTKEMFKWLLTLKQ